MIVQPFQRRKPKTENRKPTTTQPLPLLLVLGVLTACGAGCGTIKNAAVRTAGDMFSGEEALAVFTSDDDPELIRDALPFAMKTLDVLLVQDPGNDELRLAAAGLYIQYAYAFLDSEADYLEEDDPERARALRARAVTLYLRGRDYAMTVLDHAHPEFSGTLFSDPGQALASMKADDVPALYWTGASWAAAIGANPGNMSLVADLPLVEPIMRKVLALDPGYDSGSVHEFFISFEGGRGEMMGGNAELAEKHFEEAVRLSGGQRASPYIGLASTVAVARQDSEMFVALLNQALAVDVSDRPTERLPNILSQRKAQWLLDHGPDLFLEFGEDNAQQ